MKSLLVSTFAAVVLVGCATTVEPEPATYMDVEVEEKVGNDKVNLVSKKDSSTSNSNSISVSSSNSVAVSSSISYVDKDKNRGELYYKNTNGQATLNLNAMTGTHGPTL